MAHRDLLQSGEFLPESRGIHPESNLLCFPREESARTDGMEKVAGAADIWQKAIERIPGRAGQTQGV